VSGLGLVGSWLLELSGVIGGLTEFLFRHTVIFGQSAAGGKFSSFIFADSFMVTDQKTLMPHHHYL
jgi:hypothetical protein